MKNNNWLALRVLVKRNIKLYLKDRMTVFFSVLAPIIVLLLYVLFLGKIQVDSIMSELASRGIEELSRQDVSVLINNWMVAGLMGVSCITVSINTNIVMLKDKASGNINDMLSSPVKRWVIFLSYIIACFLITLVICLIVLILAIVYLACTGGLMLSFVDFLAILGITLVSTLSAACFMVLICSFMKSPSTLGAFNGVFSTAIGFLVGAYLPFSMMPNVMQYIACFIPWTYSVGLYKEYFLNGCLDFLQNKLSTGNIMDLLDNNYSLSLDFFGIEVQTKWMLLVLILSILIFSALIAIFYSNKKTNFFNSTKKRLKKHRK